MADWLNCKRILIMRLDNMGDVLMSSPAIRAVAETFKAKITLLTSTKGAEIARLMPEIERVITFDVPWVKVNQAEQSPALFKLIDLLKQQDFDGCIIFTVYSQNPMPSIMIAYLAGIPLRLAYCRENPYQLLSHWLSDDEPYLKIRHQVERDLHLVSSIGATTNDQLIKLDLPKEASNMVKEKLASAGLSANDQFIILHPGVSEKKRQYPIGSWVKCAKKLIEEFDCKMIFTGSSEENEMLIDLALKSGEKAFPLGGMFNLAELATLIGQAKVVVAVNTGIVHIASAMQTPVVVLYAQTNPQHYPWQVKSVVLEYSIPKEEKSKNEVIKFVDEKLYKIPKPLPNEADIIEAIKFITS